MVAQADGVPNFDWDPLFFQDLPNRWTTGAGWRNQRRQPGSHLDSPPTGKRLAGRAIGRR